MTSHDLSFSRRIALASAFALVALSMHATSYTLHQSGNWTDPATWGVASGYPSAAADKVLIDKNLTGDYVIDLQGQSYSITSINGSDSGKYNCGLTLKNGSITVSASSYLRNQQAKTCTVENMTLTFTGAYGDNYNTHAIDCYVNGGRTKFVGDNTLNGFYFRNYNAGVGYIFKDGVTVNDIGFSLGDNMKAFTIQMENARLSTTALDHDRTGSKSCEPVTITMTLGANNTPSSDAVMNFSGKFWLHANSTLAIDATAKTPGTYKIIQAGNLVDHAGFATKATVTTASGMAASLSLSDNVLWLELTSDTPIPPHYGTLAYAEDGQVVDVRNDTVAGYVDGYSPEQYAAAGGNAQTANDRPKSVFAFGQIFENVVPGETYSFEGQSFTVSNAQPRQISIPCNDAMSAFVSNVRDLGGWTLVNGNGRKTNFGVFFRSAKLDGISSSISHNVLTADLGVKTEVDLRPTAEAGAYVVADGATHFGTVAYYNCGMTTAEPGWRSLAADTTTGNIRKAFAAFGSSAALPALFHCTVGRDRTGVLAHIILQLCGVDRASIYRDYYLTNFAHPEDGNTIGSERPDARFEYLDGLTGKYGDSDAAHAREYLESCGVTDAQMEAVVVALTGETLAQILARAEGGEAPSAIGAPAPATGLVYNGAAQTGVANGTGYTLGDDFSATDAGDYEATATLEEGFIWDDGTTEPKTISWSIAKAPLVAKPNDEIVGVGSDVPAFTASYTGFVGDDDASVISGAPTFSTEYTSSSPAGTYAITITTLPQAANYAITAEAGELVAVNVGNFDPSWGRIADDIGPFHNEKAFVFTNTEAEILWTPTYGEMDGLTAKVLVVGGGGAGAKVTNRAGGGGGAGALIYETAFELTPGKVYSIKVGKGGAVAGSGNGGNGGESSFDTLVALGGGGGGTSAGVAGGCGGGGGSDGSWNVNFAGGAGSEHGYAGGAGIASYGTTFKFYGGGGGGAGGAGQGSAGDPICGGGAGITLDIDGTSAVYATGGDGAIYFNTRETDQASERAGTDGLGEGGSGGTSTKPPRAGGSGAVIVRYTKKVTELKIDVPQAVSGLVYDGQLKTGVVEIAGVTLAGDVTATDAGTYTATATLDDGFVWVDGTAEQKTVSWTIAKAPIVARPDRETICTGSAVPAFTASYTGFIGNDDESVLSGAPTFSTEYTDASPAGTYAVTITALPQATNYELSAEAGELVAIASGTFDPEWGWTADGLGELHNEKVFVFTNTTSEIFWAPTYEEMDGLTVQVLVVGGGGAGAKVANKAGGGGGAGALVYESAFGLSQGKAYAIKVGSGGATAASGNGGNGGESSFDTLVALGGGGGGTSAGVAGGCGGGGGSEGSWNVNIAGGAGSEHGYAGGAGMAEYGQVFKYYGAGGGGAGRAGQGNGGNPVCGGGAGVESAITGTSIVYATGGDGAIYFNNKEADQASERAGTDGLGEGGSGGTSTKNPCAGGSGTVIVRYAVKVAEFKIDVPQAIGGLIYDGQVKTGLVETAGVTFTGDVTATDAGTYTAIATLNAGYGWQDESLVGPQEIIWTVDRAANAWTVEPSVTKSEWWAASVVKGEIVAGETAFGTPVATIAKDGGEPEAFDGSVPSAVGSYVVTYSSPATDNWLAPDPAALSVTFAVRDGEPGEYDYGLPDDAPVTYEWQVGAGDWNSVTNWKSSVAREACYGIPNDLNYATASFPALDGIGEIDIVNERGIDISVMDFAVTASSPAMTIDMGGGTLKTKQEGNPGKAVRDFRDVTFRNGSYVFNMVGVYNEAYRIPEGGSVALENGASVDWSHDPFSDAARGGEGFDISISGGSKWTSRGQLSRQRTAYGARISVDGAGSSMQIFATQNLNLRDSTITASDGGIVMWSAFADGYGGSTLTATGAGSKIDITGNHSATYTCADMSFTAKDGGTVLFGGRGYNDRTFGLSGCNDALRITLDDGTLTTSGANVFNFGTATNALGSLGAPELTFKGAAPLFDAQCNVVIGSGSGDDPPVLTFAPQETWTDPVIEIAAGKTFTVDPGTIVRITTRGGAHRGSFPIARSATANAISVDLDKLNAETLFDRPPIYFTWRMSDDGKTLFIDYSMTDATIMILR